MKRSTALSAALLTAAASAGGVYLFSFGRTPLSRLFGIRSRTPEFNLCRAQQAEQMKCRPHQRCFIQSARGHRLVGYYYPRGSRPSDKLVFMVHGLHSEHREACGLYYRYYHSRGYDVFCCDNTASGESEGGLVGYGVYEREDCLQWLDYLTEHFGSHIRIALHGFSMGGATVLGMAPLCPPQVKCVVSDSAFSHAQGVLQPKMGPLYHPMRRLNRLVAGYDLSQTDVREQVRTSPLPTLFIHGSDDRVVPYEMGEELFTLHPGPKDSLFLKDVGHVEGMFAAPDAYTEALDRFLQQHMDP